jgi:hypothetical protein
LGGNSIDIVRVFLLQQRIIGLWWEWDLGARVGTYLGNICIYIHMFMCVCVCVCALIIFVESFQTNSSVHGINTRSKTHLHGPVANLSCFQKDVSYSCIKIFNMKTY